MLCKACVREKRRLDGQRESERQREGERERKADASHVILTGVPVGPERPLSPGIPAGPCDRGSDKLYLSFI